MALGDRGVGLRAPWPWLEFGKELGDIVRPIETKQLD